MRTNLTNPSLDRLLLPRQIIAHSPPPGQFRHRPTGSCPLTVLYFEAYALRELLDSERACASGLALIRQIRVPLAKGQPTPYRVPPPLFPQTKPEPQRVVSAAAV